MFAGFVVFYHTTDNRCTRVAVDSNFIMQSASLNSFMPGFGDDVIIEYCLARAIPYTCNAPVGWDIEELRDFVNERSGQDKLTQVRLSFDSDLANSPVKNVKLVSFIVSGEFDSMEEINLFYKHLHNDLDLINDNEFGSQTWIDVSKVPLLNSDGTVTLWPDGTATGDPKGLNDIYNPHHEYIGDESVGDDNLDPDEIADWDEDDWEEDEVDQEVEDHVSDNW